MTSRRREYLGGAPNSQRACLPGLVQLHKETGARWGRDSLHEGQRGVLRGDAPFKRDRAGKDGGKRLDRPLSVEGHANT